MVNRELTRRIKGAPLAVWSRKAVLCDLNRAVKLVRYAPTATPKSRTDCQFNYSNLLCRFLDEKVSIWEYAAPAESAEEGEEVSLNHTQ